MKIKWNDRLQSNLQMLSGKWMLVMIVHSLRAWNLFSFLGIHAYLFIFVWYDHGSQIRIKGIHLYMKNKNVEVLQREPLLVI